MEFVQVGAGRDHPHLVRLVTIVQAVLLLDLLVRTGDHAHRHRQRRLFGLDAPGDIVHALDLVARDAAGQQLLALAAPQRVAGVYERDAELVGKARADVAGIGIMAVQDLRQTGLFAQEGQGIVREALQIVPELLLRKIAILAAGEAHDACILGKRLDGLGVIVADAGIDDPAGQQVDLNHLRTLAQGAGQFNDVLGLPARVGIPAQFEIMAADQAMHADQRDIVTVGDAAHLRSSWHPSAPIRSQKAIYPYNRFRPATQIGAALPCSSRLRATRP